MLSCVEQLAKISSLKALKIICKDHEARVAPALTRGRSSLSVSADVDRLLSPKTLTELTALEKQISRKLESNEPIDVEYWEQLLQNVGVYKAKAELHAIYKSVIESRLDTFRREQRAEATNIGERLQLLLEGRTKPNNDVTSSWSAPPILNVSYSRQLDPEPELKLRTEERNLEIFEEENFLEGLVRS